MTSQVNNILAAITYHNQFPPHYMVAPDTITFKEGRVVDGTRLNDYEGPTLFEGGLDDCLMPGHAAALSSGIPTPLGPPSNATEICSLTYFWRDANSHMYKLNAEFQVLPGDGSNGQTFSADVAYGSGCKSMAIPSSGLNTLLTPADINALQYAHHKYCHWSLPSSPPDNPSQECCPVRQPRKLVHWNPVVSNTYSSIRRRIFGGSWKILSLWETIPLGSVFTSPARKISWHKCRKPDPPCFAFDIVL